MYFRILAITWGALLIIRGPVAYLLGCLLRRSGAGYPEKQSFWTWLVAVLELVLVAATWTLYVNTDVRHSLIVTLAVTLTVFRTSLALFNYGRFRALAAKAMLARNPWPAALEAAVGVLGVTLILLGALLY